MTHSEKVARLVSELEAKGLTKRRIAPPLFRLIWLLGLEIAPPLFLDMGSLLAIGFLCYAPAFGIVSWAFGTKASIAALFGIVAGLVGSAIGCVDFRRTAKKLQLPSWEQYGNSPQPGSKV